MVAYDYPVMGVFWSMMMFFIWFIWLILLFRIFGDIFRSHDLGGFAKAIWTIFVIVVPFLGIFVYLIARGHGMAKRSAEAAQAQQDAFAAYVQQTAAAAPAGGGSADQLAKLAELKNSGVLTDEEFAKEKAKLLA